ncbi:MAG: cell division protein FtsH, partial [Solirubrobacteraceae bacterium]|nr:cell division protein FtsH [Solirubrobacteraceae bacterium]
MPKQPAPKKSVIEQRQSTSYKLRQRLSEIGQRALKILLKDPLAWFLLLAAIALGITFFSLLDDIQPQSPGRQVTLTEVTELARDRQIATATLYDQDSRIVLVTRPEERQAREGEPPPRPAETLWAAYPSSGASTGSLLTALQRAGATIVVDQQSDIPTKKILVQFLLPILLLVTLFAFFMRLSDDVGAGGIASFSKFTGRRRMKGDNGGVTFANVAGNPDALAEL